LGIELKNKTLGIFGMGRIGMKMAQRCRAAYDMNIIYYSRTPNLKAQKKFNAKLVSFEQLLVQSDVLSVHCTLNDSTKEVFDIKAFAKMKKSAIFINTARGGIHNEKDLTQALESRQIWGAGLDVTNPEPMVKGNPLLSMENVCVLPHVGSGTREARDEMSRLAAMNLISFYKNGTIPHIVNPQVLNNEKPGKK
ncbi:MAG: D-glycerate dehydrogenase, partial [Desulfobacteraceae bacterium]|nr:D-glycerate dehydrogenase [Desulfobacteraceae bacterium]